MEVPRLLSVSFPFKKAMIKSITPTNASIYEVTFKDATRAHFFKRNLAEQGFEELGYGQMTLLENHCHIDITAVCGSQDSLHGISVLHYMCVRPFIEKG